MHVCAYTRSKVLEQKRAHPKQSLTPYNLLVLACFGVHQHRGPQTATAFLGALSSTGETGLPPARRKRNRIKLYHMQLCEPLSHSICLKKGNLV